LTTVSAVDGRGLPTTIGDPNGVTTNLTYDSERRLKTVTVDPSGLSAVTSIGYNAVGDVTRIARPNGA
jgi:YD repeat-containing protein